MAATISQDATGAPPAAEPETPPPPPSASPAVRVGELVSAAAAMLLAVDLFATKWYGVAAVPDPSAARPAISTAENGWDGLSVVRWVVALTVVAALGSVLLHVSQRGHGNKTDTSRVVAGLGMLSAVLLVYRVLIVLPSAAEVIDQKLGAVLGVLLALGVALGGLESVREQRSRAGATVRTRRRSPENRGPVASTGHER